MMAAAILATILITREICYAGDIGLGLHAAGTGRSTTADHPLGRRLSASDALFFC
jgi:hypothetical protein